MALERLVPLVDDQAAPPGSLLPASGMAMSRTKRALTYWRWTTR